MKQISLKQKIVLIIFGLFICAVLLEMGLRIGGFVLLSVQEYRNRISLKQKGSYSIMCLGESTTFGQWPVPLQEILNQKDIGIKFSVIDKGVIGTTTGNIVSLLERNLDECNPQMIITMMGINDRRYVMPYKDIRYESGVFFLTSFKVYKLIKFITFNIINKAMEIGIYEPGEKKEYFSETKDLMWLSKRREQEEILKKAIEIKDGDKYDTYLELGKYYRNSAEYHKAIEMFKKAAEMNLKDEEIYLNIAWCYRDTGEQNKAIEMFKKVLAINPENEEGYFSMGRCYRDTGEHDKAIEMFKKAIETNPEDECGYIELGRCYRDKGEYDKAIEVFKKAIETNSQNEESYLDMGWCYRDTGEHDKAIEMFKKAIEINPKNGNSYIEAGWSYQDIGEYKKAEEIFKKTIETNPEDDRGYIELGRCYRDTGEYDKAIEMFKKAIEINPKNERLNAVLAIFYKEKGEYFLAEKYSKIANDLMIGSCNLVTSYNYQKLKKIATQRGIKLVCVQYPMRNIEPLKKIFKKTENIVFVDNERLFKEAVKQEGYDEYFKDIFGGDFGHCTKKGNRLLAENISNIILKEYF
jgi:tetratricopeptide (TPR) repeat protein